VLDTRDRVFDRVAVDFLVKGGARVSWSLARTFLDPPPYEFQLQVGGTGNPAASDWEDVGDPVEGAFFAVDPTQRAYGKNPTTHYRVKLSTINGAYFSIPASVFGVMDHHNWMIARDIVRRERLRLDRTGVKFRGWLLKRMWAGATPDPKDLSAAVTDPLTGAVLRSRATSTLGTPFLSGYYAPVPFTLDKTAEGHYEQYDDADSTTDKPQNLIGCRVVMIPPVATLDAFVAQYSDRRYFFHEVKVTAEWQGVPLVASCSIRRAPSSDVIYSAAVPD